MWWMGDWWRYGEHKYGERAKAVVEDDSKAFGTWMNAGYVSGAIETSRRREALSWGHHYEVASLTPAQQTKLLKKAEVEGWTRRELWREGKALKSDRISTLRPGIPGIA